MAVRRAILVHDTDGFLQALDAALHDRRFLRRLGLGARGIAVVTRRT
jgi:hypothetical protein